MRPVVNLFIIPWLIFLSVSYSQDAHWICGGAFDIPQNSSYIGNTSYNLVIVYLDFPDGRIQPGDIIPTEDAQLDDVDNIDAVANMGYVSEDGVTWNKKARKYTYLDCWNRIFSTDEYLGSAHPDWMSHGKYGMPYASGSSPPLFLKPGDTAKGFGSVKEYFSEVSYGKFTINPYDIRSTETDYKFKTGIINTPEPSDDLGIRYLRPVLLPHTKEYYRTYDWIGLKWADIQNDAIPAVLYYTSFNITAYLNGNPNNRIIYILAGSSYGDVAGITWGRKCMVREKLQVNTSNGNWRSVIEGISVTCHEFGHTLGWGHVEEGNYCIMNTGSDNQNCPSYPNILFRLKAGWIAQEKVHLINTSAQNFTLPPSIINAGECAIVTIYGKAGYSEIANSRNYNHSEYYVIENRRMIWDNPNIHFDKKLVWRKDLQPPTPSIFNGGVLVYHYNAEYNMFPASYQDWILDRYHRIVPAEGIIRHDFVYIGDGDSRDFFGVLTSGQDLPYTNLFQTRTQSSFNYPLCLQTGIEITDINESSGTNDISFNVNYTLSSPPDYNKVLYGQYSLSDPAVTLEGSVFVHEEYEPMFIKINPGTSLDFPSVPLLINGGNLEANGTAKKPIVFQGCGYGDYRTDFEGIQIFDRTGNLDITATSFKYCMFKNLPIQGMYVLNIQNTQCVTYPNLPIVLENNVIVPQPEIPQIIKLCGKDLIIQSIKENNTNIIISSEPLPMNCPDSWIQFTGGISITQSYKLTIQPYFAKLHCLFSENAGIEINGGTLIAEGTNSSHIEFNKQIIASSWLGINVNNGFSFFKYCDIKNAITGINMNSPAIESKIIRCSFTDNVDRDISINGFEDPLIILLVDSNTFNGNTNKSVSFRCQSGINLIAKDNIFNNEYGTGMLFINITNPQIKRCNFIAGTRQGFTPIAMNLIKTGGFINCCNMSNFNTGIKLDASSPTLYNNGKSGTGIKNNSFGLYLVNGSSPLMIPYTDPEGNQINGGFNKIHDNIIADIYCENDPTLPVSLPSMNNGSNLIYGNSPHYIVTNITSGEEALAAENNWWGANEPSGDKFYPEGTVAYIPYLVNQPSSSSCDAQSTSSDGENTITTLIPDTYKLYQNYPNPFNPVTHIKYDIPEDGFIKITVYDIIGEEIMQLVNEYKKAGRYEIEFDGKNLASGIYFYRIVAESFGESNNFINVKKMVLLK